MRKIRKFRKSAVSFLTAVLLLTALTAAGTVIPSKKDTSEDLEVHFFEAGIKP